MAQQANFIIYDFETTGLKPNIHGVCEVAMLGIDSVTLEEIGRYEAIVAPYQVDSGELDEKGKPILIDYIVDPYALKVNGLTMKKIQAGTPAKEVVEEMMAFAKKCNAGSKKPILVGHNIIRFDNPHMGVLFDLHKKDPAKSFSQYYFVDTQQESHKMFPEATEKGDHTLARLCERFNVDKFDAHSAMPDVIANTEVFIKIIKKMRGESIAMEVEEKDRPRDTFNF